MTSRLVSHKRSAAKAITYRLIIVILDFVTIYLFTGKIRVAAGFMIASNVYTTVAYLLHERAWARTAWGIIEVSDRDTPHPGANAHPLHDVT